MDDALYYALAGVQSDPPLQGSDGAIAIKRYLATHGILAPELILENGSGLSRTTRISAETLHRVLSYAYQSRYMPEYLASLSIPGVDGTLRGRLTQGPEVGWMHMKTGHLDDVAALAGYVHAHNGKTYVAVLLINGEIGGTNALFDTFLQWTYRQ